MIVEPFANCFAIRQTIHFTIRSTQPTIASNAPSSTRLKVDHHCNI
jgi:hypothetical protein